MTDPLRRAILDVLGTHPTPAQRHKLATQLHTLAQEQEALAAAETRQQARPARERVAIRKVRAGRGRAPAMFVRIERQYLDRRAEPRMRVYVGRGLWYAIGSPPRLDVQFLGGQLVFRRADGDTGYAVLVGSGIPRFYADSSRELFDGYADGRYSAEIRNEAIVLGEALTSCESGT